MVLAISNRFTVLSLIEDLTSSSDGDAEAVIAARARAVKHLPSLSVTLGESWTSNEVVPFLIWCVHMDDPPLIEAITRELPRLVAHFTPRRMVPIIIALAGTSSKACRERMLTPAVITAFFKNPYCDERTDDDAINAFVELACDLLSSPWPAARGVGFELATAPLFHVYLSSLTNSDITSCRLEEAVSAALHAQIASLEQSRVTPHTDWAAMTSLAAATASTARRLVFEWALECAGDGVSPPPDLLRECLVVTSEEMPSLPPFLHSQRRLGRTAALFGDLVDVMAAHLLPSAVPWVAEAATAQLENILLAVVSGTCFFTKTKNSSHHKLTLIDCVEAVKKLIATLLSQCSASLDFRIRLITAQKLPAVSTALNALRRALLDGTSSESVLLQNVSSLVEELVSTGLRSLSQDPDSDVRAAAAQALAQLCAMVSDGSTTVILPHLLSLCDQFKFDYSHTVREPTAQAVANLCRGIKYIVDPRDRSAVYSIMLDLLRDDAVNVRVSATALLSDCIAIVGPHQVARDLAEVSSKLLSAPQWRARESLAAALGHLLEGFVKADDGACSANESSTSRALFFSDDGPKQSGAATPLVDLVTALVFDKAKAVRDAALLSLYQTRQRMTDLRRTVSLTVFGLPSTVAPIDDLFRKVLWPAVMESPQPKQSYLHRVTLLHAAVAFGIPVENEILPLMTTMVNDPVPNVRRAVAAVLLTALRTQRDSSSGPVKDKVHQSSLRQIEGAALHISPALRSGTVLELLRALTSDSDPDVRDAAATALALCY